ncbi:MAG: hypothetical protein LBV43_11675 [Prevotella sp.]|jgi:hypothetical protein|nr:hypothetical protein [Prevotella sp.]
MKKFLLIILLLPSTIYSLAQKDFTIDVHIEGLPEDTRFELSNFGHDKGFGDSKEIQVVNTGNGQFKISGIITPDFSEYFKIYIGSSKSGITLNKKKKALPMLTGFW